MENGRRETCDRLRICKIYFFAGIAFLPFLWLVNVVWFFRDAFFGPPSNTRKKFQLCKRCFEFYRCFDLDCRPGCLEHSLPSKENFLGIPW
ncbi:presenilin enhancer 2 [Echinococcus multilocularis]|uniref:Presenilin enhancer 2 n=1 Tax=Echinococcus multilocularis TaxID=6211 RepID=A0A087W2B9_ECHMU|nr:presenilin enhancer 2 [Echinococcus multilocularis]